MTDSDCVGAGQPSQPPSSLPLPYIPSTFGRKRPLHSSPHLPHTHSTTAMSTHSHSHSHPHSHSHSHSDPPSSSTSSHTSESLLEAEHFVDVIYHFEMYAQHSLHQLHRLEADYRSIPTPLQHITPAVLPRLTHLRSLVLANHTFLRHLTAHRAAFMTDDTINYPLLEQRRTAQPLTSIDSEKLSKIRSTLRQCTRDWSTDGSRERATCYLPILKELERLWPERSERRGRQVLVPGCGLGRLVWEVSRLGLDATGNEFSYYMLLCSYVILNECGGREEFTIYPYIHDSRNVMKAEDQTREVKFPDVDVTAGLSVDGSSSSGGSSGVESEWVGRLSMVAGDFMDIYSEDGVQYRQREKEQVQDAINRAYELSHTAHNTAANNNTTTAASASAVSMAEESDSESDDDVAASTATTSPPSSSSTSSSSSSASLPPPSSGPSYASSFDAVTTCFFIDCSNNILACLQTIAYILKPGGYWINFGPLLYHYSDMPGELSVELTWEEVKSALPHFGLKVLCEKGGRQSGYCVDERSMQRSYFYCVECTCQKVGGDTTRGEESGMVRKKTRRGKGKKARGGGGGGGKVGEKGKMPTEMKS